MASNYCVMYCYATKVAILLKNVKKSFILVLKRGKHVLNLNYYTMVTTSSCLVVIAVCQKALRDKIYS